MDTELTAAWTAGVPMVEIRAKLHVSESQLDQRRKFLGLAPRHKKKVVNTQSVVSAQALHLNRDVQRPMGISVNWRTPSLHKEGCLWPEDGPDGKVHFCGAERVGPGASYCKIHWRRAYQPASVRRGQDVRLAVAERVNR